MMHPTDKANTEPTWMGHRRHAFTGNQDGGCEVCAFGALHPVHHPPTDAEIATAEQAATDAERRYQARERGLREAAQASEPWPEPPRERTIANFIPHAPENKPTRLERKLEEFADELAPEVRDTLARILTGTRPGRKFEKVSLPAAATAPNAFDPGAIAEIEADNERGLRAAQRELDAAVARAEAERLDPPRAFRAGDGPMPDLEGVAQRMHAMGTTPSSAPIRQPLTIAGTFRVYFNRHQAAPLVWCVATDRIELAVAEVIITSTFGARTVYAPKATPDHEDGKPSAWLEVDGVLRIDPNSSTARIG